MLYAIMIQTFIELSMLYRKGNLNTVHTVPFIILSSFGASFSAVILVHCVS